MALTIGSATIGADSEGLEDLYTKIHAECIEEARELVNKTDKVKEAIRECWNGSDEKKFEENLNTFVGKVDAALQTYDEAIKNEFNSLFQRWVEFQSKHVS